MRMSGGMTEPNLSPASAPAAPARASAPPSPQERRTNARLRELIDEMLVIVRVAVYREHWTGDEREAAAAELSRIMDAVRAEAVGAPPRRAR